MASQKRQRETERRRAAGMVERSAWLLEREQQREAAAYLRTLGRAWAEVATMLELPSADAARMLASRAPNRSAQITDRPTESLPHRPPSAR